MAGDLNRVTIIGRLVRDPELKYIQSGSAVANFSVACNRYYTTAGGEKKEEVSYFDSIAWGKLGEIVVEYCKKGKRIAIEGRLQQNRWEDQDGKTRSKIEIVADNVQFLDAKGAEQPSAGDNAAIPQQASPPPQPIPTNTKAGDNPFSDEEIPF